MKSPGEPKDLHPLVALLANGLPSGAPPFPVSDSSFSLLPKVQLSSRSNAASYAHSPEARILAACTAPHLAPLRGRCLQPWRKGVLTSHHSLGIFMALQPWSQQGRGLWGTQPRLLGALASRGALEQKSSTEGVEQFQLIYRFPAIKYCRAVSRLKLLQTAITILALPPVWFLYWQNHISLAQCRYSTGIAGFAAVMLYGMSFYFRRIIGMMYLNEDGTTLRVAHLTFWGRRKDIYCPVETVMPLGDMTQQNDVLLQFRQSTDPQAWEPDEVSL
ncbi:transmembrane protein 186 isoform X2 [Varanus komodoensis]|uniref:transmembrane protein 186 isoform X2 n=1 Tax=Varanus komodoensis TaxID=61221 RepID=UPI001CF7D03F|nr:transmembrane protein 186 isoform X2 [Varanus komodoensis]